MCDGYDALLRHRLSSTARRVLREVCLRKSVNLSAWLTVKQMDGEQKTNGLEDAETRREYELVFCRLDGCSRLLYVR
jgi:hypothetical protein